MLLFALLAVAFDAPPVAEVVTVAFGAGGERVAIETRWVEEGPGFPNAKIDLRDTSTGALLGTWSARLVEADANRGFAGASADARAKAAGALAEAGVDLGQPATAYPCAGGACGPAGTGGGCVRARDRVRFTLTTTPTQRKIEQCYGRGTPHLLTLSVQGHTWVAESEPADGCPSSWRAEAAYVHGDRAVLLLAYDVPGHEGLTPRRTALAGRLR